jgi:CRISPR/Cas system CSM-associated protein Csm3 (group 7 of RAMP superfamily)
MNDYRAHWNKSREIVERVIVTGDLVLLTPTHLGSGDADGPTDMSLLLDPLTETRALLTGASVAGALRNYLREREYGYEAPLYPKQGSRSTVELLFGGERDNREGEQSALIVEDALSQAADIEVRDGVCIDPTTRTAMVEEERQGRKRGYKFDLELLQAGATFPLCFELLIPQGENQRLKAALARALQGLELGEVALGARKRRGYGECRVEKWRVMLYDLTTTEGLLAWLKSEQAGPAEGPHIADLLGVQPDESDQRSRFEIRATFRLEGSMLIRSGFAESDTGPDMVHLHSYRPGRAERVPVLPGTSLAGVVRHRALRIANTLAPNSKGQAVVEGMFGRSRTRDDQTLTASRVLVRETVIEGTRSLVQSRVKIDRFTGGAFPTALFTEQPIFGRPESRVTVELTLRNPQPHEIGLLLLVLKDLWTEDLPVGGESSVGRGRLAGVEADLVWRKPGSEQKWTLKQVDSRLEVAGDEKKFLEGYVQALKEELGGGAG